MGTKNFSNYSDMITFSRASTGTYLDSDGLLKSAATNTPRVEYDYQGNRLGLLVEEARTNLENYSETFAAGWSLAYSSFTDQKLSPSGENTAKEVTVATANTNYFYKSYTASPSTTYTFSFFCKSGTIDVENDLILAFYDESNLSFISSNATRTYTSSVNGFTRVHSTVTTPAGCTVLRCYPHRNITVAGTYDIYGVQLEAGTFPTSYIPTSGATATRSADVASIGVGAFGYNKTAGTVLITYELPDDTVAYLFELDDPASGNNRWVMYRNGVNLRKAVIRAGSNIHDSVVTSTLPPGTNIAAMSVDDTVVKGVSNGEAVTSTAGNFAVETGITQLTLGSNRGVGSWLNSHISSIAYYPRRLTDAQIKALTSPPETPTLSLTFDDSSTSYLETSIHG